jgi:hypothetical protein
LAELRGGVISEKEQLERRIWPEALYAGAPTLA